ncbi:hypothetical protein TcCL_NonESM03735, partial [Trypanosoma cruzi]
MAQKHIQCAAAARGQARQTVTDGEFKRIRREGPIHITVTRGHASTKCADSTGDRSACDSDSVTDKQIFLLPRQSTNAVPTVPRHGRCQRAGDAVPPCLAASQAWAREGTKLLRTDHKQHGEVTAEGMIAVLPFADIFS